MKTLVGGASEGIIPLGASLALTFDSIFKRMSFDRPSTKSDRSSLTSSLSCAIS